MSKTSQLILLSTHKPLEGNVLWPGKCNTYFITLTNENFLTPSGCSYVFSLAKEDLNFFSWIFLRLQDILDFQGITMDK